MKQWQNIITLAEWEQCRSCGSQVCSSIPWLFVQKCAINEAPHQNRRNQNKTQWGTQSETKGGSHAVLTTYSSHCARLMNGITNRMPAWVSAREGQRFPLRTRQFFLVSLSHFFSDQQGVAYRGVLRSRNFSFTSLSDSFGAWKSKYVPILLLGKANERNLNLACQLRRLLQILLCMVLH